MFSEEYEEAMYDRSRRLRAGGFVLIASSVTGYVLLPLIAGADLTAFIGLVAITTVANLFMVLQLWLYAERTRVDAEILDIPPRPRV